MGQDVESPKAQPEVRHRKLWVEPVAAVVMALATLFTAWCSYESAAWTRQSNRLMNEFNSVERKAGLLSLQGLQTANIHIALFMQALGAKQAGNDALADFYIRRFPPELRKAYDAWLAQKPLENPDADPHPFVPKLYQIPGTAESYNLTQMAAGKVQQARQGGTYSGQYLANTVLFATVLFFANAASRFEQRRVRIVAFMFACAVFLFAVTRTIILPTS